jgi:hypothetical protein
MALSGGGRNSGGEGDTPGIGASETTRRSTPVAVIGGHGVGDRHPDVGPVQGEPMVAEGVHQRDQVVGEGGGVVPVLGFVG